MIRAPRSAPRLDLVVLVRCARFANLRPVLSCSLTGDLLVSVLAKRLLPTGWWLALNPPDDWPSARRCSTLAAFFSVGPAEMREAISSSGLFGRGQSVETRAQRTNGLQLTTVHVRVDGVRGNWLWLSERGSDPPAWNPAQQFAVQGRPSQPFASLRDCTARIQKGLRHLQRPLP